jgi:dihydrofolate reductase
MSRVVADISVSLDGFITGPNDSVEEGLGEGGEVLHEWVVRLASWRAAHGYEGGETGPEDEFFAASFGGLGAIVMGRRMFDHGEGPWGEEPPFHIPVFVLTHRPREPLVKQGGTTFTFVEDGLEAALDRARAVAGGKDIGVSAADVIGQCIAGGLLDELTLHVVPVFLGGGVRLFDGLGPADGRFECVEAFSSSEAVHLRFRPRR